MGKRAQIRQTDKLLGKILESRWEKLCARLESFQADGTAESVRKLRVSLRKLLTNLDVALQTAESRSGPKAMRRLKKAKKALGGLRDTQMLQQRLKSLHLWDPGKTELLDWLKRREQKRLRRLEPVLRKLNGRQIHRHICEAAFKAERALQKRHETPEELWQRLVGKAVRQVNRRYEALDPQDLETIHDLRIAFKKLRYLKEAAAGPQKDFPALKALQDKMGEVQDWEVLLHTIHDYANRKGEGTFRKLTALRKTVLLKRNRAVREFWKVRGGVLQWKGNGVL